MKFLNFLFLFLFCVFIEKASCQQVISLDSLVENVKVNLSLYEDFLPFGSDFYSLHGYGITTDEINRMIEKEEISQGTDSADFYVLQWIVQERIDRTLAQIVVHPDFKTSDVQNLLGESMYVVVSPDHKLFNFSFDENTGGSYLSRISYMFYTDLKNIKVTPQNQIELKENPYSIFYQDGYYAIDTLVTSEGVKYLLQ